MNTHRSLLVMMRGLPGSGKSYIADSLVKELGPDRVVVLDPDTIDREGPEYQEHSRELAEQGLDEKFHPHRFLISKARKGVNEYKILLWNQPFTSLPGFQKTITWVKQHAEERGVDLRLMVVEVEVSAEVAKSRIAERKAAGGHGPSDNTFLRFLGDYQTFSTEGYDVVIVNGEDDVTRSVTTITRAIEQELNK